MANTQGCLGQVANTAAHAAMQQIIKQYTGQQAQAQIAAHLNAINTQKGNIAVNVAAMKHAAQRFVDDKTIDAAWSILDHDVRRGDKTGNRFGNVTDGTHAVFGNMMRAGGEAFTFLEQPWFKSFANLIHPWREVGRTKGFSETELVKALGNQPTNNPQMKALADAYQRAYDVGNAEYKANANIDYPKGIVPKHYVPENTTLVSRQQFINEHMGNVAGTTTATIDRGGMTNPTTRKPFQNDAELRAFLSDAYDDIITNGRSVYANNPTAARIDRPSNYIQYTPEGWFSQRKLMDKNVASIMIGNLGEMARDIAVVKQIGLNPGQFKRFISNELRLNVDENAVNKWDHYYDTFMNQSDMQRPENRNIAGIAAGLRQLTSAAYLGSSAIRSVLLGDSGVIANRLVANNIGFNRYLNNWARAFRNGDVSLREALSHGDLWDARSYGMFDMARTWGEHAFVKTGINNVTHTVLSASFLEKLPQNERIAVTRAMRGALVDEANKTFDKVKQKSLLEAYGITPQDWDVFRQTVTQIPGTKRSDFDYGKLWDNPNKDVRDIGYKFKKMEISEARSMVYSDPHARTMANINVAKRGTLAGEATRSFFQFGQWPMTAWMHNYGGPLRSDIPLISKAKFMAGALLAGTTASAMSLQAYQILQGKDPHPIDAKFIASAIIGSDVLGRWGEVIAHISGLANPYSPEFGQVASAMDMFPATGLLSPIGERGQEVIHKWYQTGDFETAFTEAHWLRTFTDYTRKFGAAFGGQLWYTKLAFERLVVNELEKLLDPDGYETRQDRAQSRLETQGQGYIWAPPR